MDALRVKDKPQEYFLTFLPSFSFSNVNDNGHHQQHNQQEQALLAEQTAKSHKEMVLLIILFSKYNASYNSE